MDLISGIYLSLVIAFTLCTSSVSGTLYLQPHSKEHGSFTGDSYFVTCFTTDPNLSKVVWSDNDGNPITQTEGRVHTQVSDGQETGLRLVFTSFEKEDAGKYTCADDKSNAYVDITIYRSVTFGDTPHQQHAAEGDSATVICNVKSDPKPLVNWSFKNEDRNIQNSEKYKILENHSLKIHHLQRSDAGEYICKAYVITPHNTQVKDFTIQLHVQYKPEVIGEHPLSVFSTMGKTKNLVCNITSEPKPMFNWLRDEMIIHNGTEELMIFDTENSSVLQMPIDDAKRWGEYICRGSNPLGHVEVTIDLKEGATPGIPELSVTGEDQGVVKLSLRVHPEDRKMSEDLKVDGFKVEYILASETWDSATSQDFVVGEVYELRNMSFNSDYHLRAAARNAAGYGNFTEDVAYRTHSLETAPVIGGASVLASAAILLLASIGLPVFY